MNKLKSPFNLLLGLALIAATGWAVWWIVLQIGSLIGGLSDSLKATVITAVSVVTVAVITYFVNKSLEMKRSVEQTLRPRKLAMYEDFNKFFMRIFGNEKVQKRPTEKEIMKFFADNTPELLTLASNSVIKKWGTLRVGLEEGSSPDKLFLVEDMLKEVRIDLGHGRRGSKKGDILRLFVNDIDDHINKSK
jgi:hypothetical protein